MPPQKSTAKTRADTIFEEYLNRHSLTFEREALPGKRQPDYLIHGPSGDCIAEVKQIEKPKKLPSNGFNPDRFVRAKIHGARKQFREYKDLPCSLAIYSESIFGPSDPGILLSAAFGPGHQQIGRDYSRIDPNPSFYRFFKRSELPPDRHFLAEAMLSPAANTTFSALILLAHYELSELHFEVWKRLYVMQEAGQEVSHNDQFRLLSELGPTVHDQRRFAGKIRVTVIENRHARLPFPEDLFLGPFDQRWGWQGDLCGPIWIGETLARLYEEGVPFYML